MAALPRGEGLSCLILATIEGKRRGKKNRREPDSVGARGDAALDPTDRFTMTPRLEMCRGGGEADRGAQHRVAGGERPGDRKTLDRFGRFAAEDIDPTAAAPAPGQPAIEAERPVAVNGRGREVIGQRVADG